MKVRDVLKRLADDGWYVERIRGSHRQLKHPTKPGTVTVAGRLNVVVPIGTLHNIWRQAGIREEA